MKFYERASKRNYEIPETQMLSSKKVATSLCIAFEDLSSRKRSGMELGRIGKEFPQYPWVLEAPCRSQRGFRRWMSVSHGSLSPRQTYPRYVPSGFLDFPLPPSSPSCTTDCSNGTDGCSNGGAHTHPHIPARMHTHTHVYVHTHTHTHVFSLDCLACLSRVQDVRRLQPGSRDSSRLG